MAYANRTPNICGHHLAKIARSKERISSNRARLSVSLRPWSAEGRGRNARCGDLAGRFRRCLMPAPLPGQRPLSVTAIGSVWPVGYTKIADTICRIRNKPSLLWPSSACIPARNHAVNSRSSYAHGQASTGQSTEVP